VQNGNLQCRYINFVRRLFIDECGVVCMSELFDSEFINKIQRIALSRGIIVTGGAGGNRKSRQKGSSVEFSDYREYSEGDDFRRIDWNAYGRFEKLYVKLFMEEREAPINIFLDTSKSMDWGEPNKSFASRRLAAALGYMSLCSYDRVSVICLSDRVEKSRESLRGKHFLPELLLFLENIEYKNGLGFYEAIKSYNLKADRGVSIVISDLFSPGELTEIIKYLQYRKQDVYICQILAPQEIMPEINSNLRLVDSETGDVIDVTMTPRLLKSYSKVYNDFMLKVQEDCFRKGAYYYMMNSEMPIEQMIGMF
jgi:hypothetical protein